MLKKFASRGWVLVVIEVLACEISFSSEPVSLGYRADEDVTEGTIDGATTARRILFHGDRP